MALSSLFGLLIKLKTGVVLFDPSPHVITYVKKPMWNRVKTLNVPTMDQDHAGLRA